MNETDRVTMRIDIESTVSKLEQMIVRCRRHVWGGGVSIRQANYNEFWVQYVSEEHEHAIDKFEKVRPAIWRFLSLLGTSAELVCDCDTTMKKRDHWLASGQVDRCFLCDLSPGDRVFLDGDDGEVSRNDVFEVVDVRLNQFTVTMRNEKNEDDYESFSIFQEATKV